MTATTESHQHTHHVSSILVPTDFSANADLALRWGMRLAEAHNATLTLLHVTDAVVFPSLPLEIQQRIDDRMAALEASVRESGAIVSCIRRTGRVWERVVAEAAAHDLVVIGARGQTPGAVHPFGVGSVADRVLRASPSPVLTVHLGDEVPEELPNRILVGTDFSDGARAAIRAFADITAPTPERPLDVTLVHAWQPVVEYEWAFAGAVVPNPIEGTEAESIAMLERTAAELASDLVRVHPIVRVGHPARIIEDEAEALDPEAIVLGTHGRTGLGRFMLGSVAEHVIHHVTCPVLTAHYPAADAATAFAEEVREAVS